MPETVAPVQEPAVAATTVAKGSVARLFTNSAAMALTNLAGRGLSYAYIILMAKRLDVHVLGAYAILVSASMVLELVSNLGLDKILIREIARSGAAEGRVTRYAVFISPR